MYSAMFPSGTDYAFEPFSAAQVMPAAVAPETAVPTFMTPTADCCSRAAVAPAHESSVVAPMVSNAFKSQLFQQQNELFPSAAQSTRKAGIPFPGLPQRYELISKLGDGTFSIVYKAYDHVLGKKVALKIVRKLDTATSNTYVDPKVVEQSRATSRSNILQEIQLMRRLKHPNIVQLLDFYESSEHCFLAMELLEGGELFEQIVKLTYFSEDLSRHVIVQVAEAIRFMHEECGIVHRDIKPENLLFEEIDIIPSNNPVRRMYDENKMDEGVFRPGIGGGGIGRVAIADFGLSKILWDDNTKTPCGTVGYAAPEIVRDEHYSKSVDMWALGCVLYTILCGFPPFYDESIQTLSEKVSRGQYTFLSPWWDEISDSAKDLVSHLLCVEVDKRYTIEQFFEHPWVRGEHARAPPTPLTMPIHKQWHALVGSNSMDSPLLASLHNGNDMACRSANVHQLREAFDVSFAVHRIEEERACNERMMHAGGGHRAAAWRKINPGYDPLAEVSTARYRYGNQTANLISDKRASAGLTDKGAKPSSPNSFNLSLDNSSILERRRRAINSPNSSGPTVQSAQMVIPNSVGA